MNLIHVPAPPELLEVVDATNRPLLILPREEVHRQQLLHRSVLVLVFDEQNRLFLQKRSRTKEVYPGRWDVSASGHILAGESRDAAACRELLEELGFAPHRIVVRQEIPASPATGQEFVTLFTTRCTGKEIRTNEQEVEDGYFVDHEELGCMLREYPELLTPALLHFGRSGLVFSPKMGS
jgi:isopentenyl-diphosphate Delta-isomerase